MSYGGARRLSIQGKRIRMARAALNVSLMDFAALVSSQLGERISHEKLRRIEHGERDIEYGLLQAIASVVGDAISSETTAPV